jgi:acetate kinase
MGTILAINAGSTSLKLHLVDQQDRSRVVSDLEHITPNGIDAVAHRVVHGGLRFTDPVVIDSRVHREIENLQSIAPLHNAPALAAIDAARRQLPHLTHVAVFDTAFHANMPPRASTYAIPQQWRANGVRRFGFHGLSLSWAVVRTTELLGQQASSLRIVACHLGGGCSVTGIADGDSKDTTMGFSPLEGVPMTTRSGSIDPDILPYLTREGVATPDQLHAALNTSSGLLALAGTADVQQIEADADAGNAGARTALELFCYRIAGAVGSMMIAAGGLDVLIFTGGIGERSTRVRRDVCAHLDVFGVLLSDRANSSGNEDRDIASASSHTRVLVIHSREEVTAAREARKLVCLN